MSTLSLQFTKNVEGKTYLKNQYASYPFHICRTQYFENDPPGMANVYIQSASGGIYENEELTTSVTANSHSYSHVTTQASTIVHGMTNGGALQTVNVNAANHAYTEFISDPLILFPESKLRSNINVYADKTSTAIVADAFLLHFLKGENDLFKQLNTYLHIYTENGELLAKDVYRANPENFLNNNRHYISMGTLTLVNRANICEGLLTSIRQIVESDSNIYGGATLLPNNCGLMVKFLAPDGDSLKKALLRCWVSMRESIIGIRPNIRKK